MNDDQPKTFTFINDEELVSISDSATKHIIYAAPSISEAVAKSLCRFIERNENPVLRVIIDADPEAFRLGFGEQAGLKMLVEKQIDVRCSENLRIAVLLADENAWVYSPTPEIIFEQPTDKVNNAVKVNVEFARQILFSIAPDISVVKEEDILEESFLATEREPEIGAKKITAEVLEKIDKSLKENQPQKFNQTRKVRVYNGYIQYVELKLGGCRVASRRMKVPDSLLNLTYDPELKIEIRSTCALFDEPLEFVGEMQIIESELNQLRRKFLKSLGERYGWVILRSKREKFDEQVLKLQKQINLLRNSIEESVKIKILRRREKLIEMLLPSVKENPPQKFKSYLFPIEDDIREYISEKLDREIPYPETLIDQLQLYCNYKDVTFDGLNDKEFINLVQEKYPDIELPKLYFEEETLGQRKFDGRR